MKPLKPRPTKNDPEQAQEEEEQPSRRGVGRPRSVPPCLKCPRRLTRQNYLCSGQSSCQTGDQKTMTLGGLQLHYRKLHPDDLSDEIKKTDHLREVKRGPSSAASTGKRTRVQGTSTESKKPKVNIMNQSQASSSVSRGNQEQNDQEKFDLGEFLNQDMENRGDVHLPPTFSLARSHDARYVRRRLAGIAAYRLRLSAQ
ncbi:hypothetical protein T439DRAFT_331251 [Meredithblackwellia eburnea MCA 4105]